MSALVLDGAFAFLRVLSPLVSHCLPSCFPLLDVCPPSQGLVSLSPQLVSQLVCQLCLSPSLSSFLLPFVGWCARLSPRLLPSLSPSLFPSLSPSLSPSLTPSLSSRQSPSLSPALSPASLPHCFPLLDGVSMSRRFVFPACLPALFPFVGWRVRLPEVLSPIVSLLVSLCWMLCPPSRGLVSQLVFLLVSLCWMVCPASQGLVWLVSQLVSQLVFLLVSLCWMVCLFSRGLVSLVFLLVSLSFSLPSVATKLAKPKNNKREVVGSYCRHYHDSCRCYFMCLTCSSKHFSTHCLVSTVV